MHYRVGLTRIPSTISSKLTQSALESNQYRYKAINHLKLRDLGLDSTLFVALRHWHPVILEHHHKSKVGSGNKMFPKGVSFALGREAGFERYQQFAGSKLTDTKYYINCPTTTIAFFNNYLDTVFVDRQIELMASGSSSLPSGILSSLSTCSSETISVDVDVFRLSSVKQKSTFYKAEIMYEEKLMIMKDLKDMRTKEKVNNKSHEQ